MEPLRFGPKTQLRKGRVEVKPSTDRDPSWCKVVQVRKGC